jgi:hypothetical protein
MNVVLIVAVIAISTTVVHAQDEPDIVKLKADTENVVKVISSDKLRSRPIANLLI